MLIKVFGMGLIRYLALFGERDSVGNSGSQNDSR